MRGTRAQIELANFEQLVRAGLYEPTPDIVPIEDLVDASGSSDPYAASAGCSSCRSIRAIRLLRSWRVKVHSNGRAIWR
jgi:hypothetical protein